MLLDFIPDDVFLDLSLVDPLCLAASRGHDDILKLLFNKGNADPNTFDVNSDSPLHHASENGHKACVEILLDHGARRDR